MKLCEKMLQPCTFEGHVGRGSSYTLRQLAFGKLVAMKVATSFKALGFEVFLSPENSVLDAILKVDILVRLNESEWTPLQIKPSWAQAERHFARFGRGIEVWEHWGLPQRQYRCPSVVLLGQDGELYIQDPRKPLQVVTSTGFEVLRRHPAKLFILR